MVARATLAKLVRIGDELALISARETDEAEPREDLEIGRRLLGVKAASLSASVAEAVRDVRPRYAAAAASLKRAANDELQDIIRALPPVTTEPHRRAAPVVPWAESGGRLHYAGWLRMAAMGVLVFALASSLGIFLLTRSGNRDQGSLAGTWTTPEEEVAGSFLRRTPGATPLQAPDAASVTPLDFTFDTLVTDAAPSGWEALGGTATGVAYPNAVDRSVQLVAATEEEASLCTALPAGEVELVSLELFAQSWAGAAVRLEGRAGSFGLQIGLDGIAAVQPDDTPLLAQPLQAGWYRVSFNFEPGTDRVGLSIGPREGAGRTRFAQLRDGWNQTAAADARLCLYAPSAAGGELYVDNVTIR